MSRGRVQNHRAEKERQMEAMSTFNITDFPVWLSFDCTMVALTDRCRTILSENLILNLTKSSSRPPKASRYDFAFSRALFSLMNGLLS